MKNILTLLAILFESLIFVTVSYADCTPSRTYTTLQDTWCNGPNLTITKSERNTIRFNAIESYIHSRYNRIWRLLGN